MAQQPYTTDAGTKLLYHFNETSGTSAADSSGGSRNATYGTGLTINATSHSALGKAIQPAAGLTNRAYWTDTGQGTNSFLYPHTSTNFTIEGWFKWGSTTTFTNQRILFAVQPTGSANIDYSLYVAPSSDATRPRGLVFRDSTGFRVYTGALTWTADTWYHIAVVVKQGTTSTSYALYRTPSGTTTPNLVASSSAALLTPASGTADRVVSIGNFYGDSGNDFFPGLVDEFRYSMVAREQSDLSWAQGPTILSEATAPNSETFHPLPLMGSWQTGKYGYIAPFGPHNDGTSPASDHGYSPAWQATQLATGKHMLPWFEMPDPFVKSTDGADWTAWVNYYQNGLTYAANNNLPIVFVGPQWEELIYDWDRTESAYKIYNWRGHEDPFKTLEGKNSPFVYREDGEDGSEVETTNYILSPWGTTVPWEEAGEIWASSALMQWIQTVYPNPPYVMFLSNNEAQKLQWKDAETDKHYFDASYTAGGNDSYKVKATGEGWAIRYRAMQDAMRDSLTSSWADKSIFAGYNAVGQGFFARWPLWKESSMYINPADSVSALWHYDPNPFIWDGGSLRTYMTAGITDSKVLSPQVEASNEEFIRKEALTLNPDFWFEQTYWNGSDSTPNPSYLPQRYGGMAQFCMWTLRPRVVRDFRGWSTPRGTSTGSQPYFDSLMSAVDRVYSNPTLSSYWRNSQLVVNTAHMHPYKTALPTEASSEERRYLLTTNLDPTPWSTTTSPAYTSALPVSAMARVKGASPSRQWLVYVFAPEAAAGTPTSVTVTLPGYGNITVNAPVEGAFYLVNEGSATIQVV